MSVEGSQPGASGRAVRSAFEAACAERGIAARWSEHDPVPAFADREDARGDQLADRYLEELAALGVRGAMLEPDAALDAAEVTVVVEAIELAVARVATLLVEAASFHTGGMPFVFATELDVLRCRGLAMYRYPARAAARVQASSGRVTVRIEEGPVGHVTSAGFYVPTRMRGDLEATVDYRLGPWAPGPDSACAALFVHDEPPTRHTYAQLLTYGDPASIDAMAVFMGRASPQREAVGPAGSLRLNREGGDLRAWHRHEGRAWRLLGESRIDPESELLVGCKVWTKVACGGLSAEFIDLVLRATPVEDPGPMPAVRPDPRGCG